MHMFGLLFQFFQEEKEQTVSAERYQHFQERKVVKADSNVSDQIKRIANVGLPNSGKSPIFNDLTGEYATVANYPLTTIELQKSHWQIRNHCCEVINTPGLHCLYINSEEELVVRDMIFSENLDVIIQCIDANRQKQSRFVF